MLVGVEREKRKSLADWERVHSLGCASAAGKRLHPRGRVSALRGSIGGLPEGLEYTPPGVGPDHYHYQHDPDSHKYKYDTRTHDNYE